MSRALLILDSPQQRQKAAHWVANLKDGTRVEFKEPKRSTEQNDRMWAMLTEVSQQLPWHGLKLATDDWKLIFLDALKRDVRMVPNIDGNGFVNLGKSSSDLSKGEMTDLIELIFAFGANHGVKFREPSPANAPTGDAGSGEALSSEPATEETGIEAADGQTAVPASEPINPGQRLLMEECIDNMLRDAVSEPAIERPVKVDKLRDIFLTELPDHEEFVQRCHETARRIIGKSGEKARAREYLMSKVPT